MNRSTASAKSLDPRSGAPPEQREEPSGGRVEPLPDRSGAGLNIAAMLLQEGFVTSEQIAKAHARQKANGHKLGYNLIELGFVESATITMMLERQFRVRGVDLGTLEVDAGVLKLIPIEIANRTVVRRITLRRFERN